MKLAPRSSGPLLRARACLQPPWQLRCEPCLPKNAVPMCSRLLLRPTLMLAQRDVIVPVSKFFDLRMQRHIALHALLQCIHLQHKLTCCGLASSSSSVKVQTVAWELSKQAAFAAALSAWVRPCS